MKQADDLPADMALPDDQAQLYCCRDNCFSLKAFFQGQLSLNVALRILHQALLEI